MSIFTTACEVLSGGNGPPGVAFVRVLKKFYTEKGYFFPYHNVDNRADRQHVRSLVRIVLRFLPKLCHSTWKYMYVYFYMNFVFNRIFS